MLFLENWLEKERLRRPSLNCLQDLRNTQSEMLTRQQCSNEYTETAGEVEFVLF